MPSSGERSIARLCCQNITWTSVFNHPVSEEPALTQPQKIMTQTQEQDTQQLKKNMELCNCKEWELFSQSVELKNRSWIHCEGRELADYFGGCCEELDIKYCIC